MKFTVPVVRISYQHHDIEVEADTQEEANQAALDQAGNHLYNEKHVEYQLADEPDIKTTAANALQGAYTMISDLSNGFPESELHQTPEQQLEEIEQAMKAIGSTVEK